MKKPGAIWKELVKNLGRKPATVLYPKERLTIPPNFRGKPVFYPEKCIGCQLCVRNCPSEAIVIEKVADKKFACTFYLDRCIYCGQCQDICWTRNAAIIMSQVYELAAFDRKTLIDTKKPDLSAPQPETVATN